MQSVPSDRLRRNRPEFSIGFLSSQEVRKLTSNPIKYRAYPKAVKKLTLTMTSVLSGPRRTGTVVCHGKSLFDRTRVVQKIVGTHYRSSISCGSALCPFAMVRHGEWRTMIWMATLILTEGKASVSKLQ